MAVLHWERSFFFLLCQQHTFKFAGLNYLHPYFSNFVILRTGYYKENERL